jgi:hypothetical protein
MDTIKEIIKEWLIEENQRDEYVDYNGGEDMDSICLDGYYNFESLYQKLKGLEKTDKEYLKEHSKPLNSLKDLR